MISCSGEVRAGFGHNNRWIFCVSKSNPYNARLHVCILSSDLLTLTVGPPTLPDETLNPHCNLRSLFWMLKPWTLNYYNCVLNPQTLLKKMCDCRIAIPNHWQNINICFLGRCFEFIVVLSSCCNISAALRGHSLNLTTWAVVVLFSH